jgi:hypothetical protein
VTLPIDLQFKGVGRVHVRSGTGKKRVRDAMKDMLRTLHQIGRADLLRDVKANRVTLLDLYEKYRTGKLEQLPTGDLMRPLDAAWREWMDGHEVEELTRADYEKGWTRTQASPGAMLTELPTLLQAYRKSAIKVRPRTFNLDRSMWLAFLNETFGDAHWLHQAVRRIKPLKIPEANRQARHPLTTVDEARALAGKMAPHHAATFWAFCLTGMRPEEMFEERKNTWALEAELVRVNGTKSPAARRVVPRVGLIVKPQTGRLAFYRALRVASGKMVTPYDLRRTYHQWLDLARVPQFRQSFYVGHGPKNLDELYKRMRECLPSLREDAAALEVLVGVGSPVLKVMA